MDYEDVNIGEDSLDIFLGVYIDSALKLADRSYGMGEFYFYLNHYVSEVLNLPLDAVDHISQPIAGMLYEENGIPPILKMITPQELWRSRIITNTGVPSNDEKSKLVNFILSRFRLEMEGRVKRLCIDDENVRSFFTT